VLSGEIDDFFVGGTERTGVTVRWSMTLHSLLSMTSLKPAALASFEQASLTAR